MTFLAMNGEERVASEEVASSINALAFWIAVSPMDRKTLAVVAIEERLT